MYATLNLLSGRSNGYRRQATADDTGKTFSWNGADRITAVPNIASYAYDGLGKRYKTTKTSNGEIEYTIYSRAGTMLYSHTPANGEFTDYLYLGNIPLAQVKTTPDPTPPPQDPVTGLVNAVNGQLPPELQLDLAILNNPTVKTVLQLIPGLPPQVTAITNSLNDGNGQPQTATEETKYLRATAMWTAATG